MSSLYGFIIVRDGLVLYLDAASIKSYPRTGSEWKDLSQNKWIADFINGPTFDGESIIFNGSTQYGRITNFNGDTNLGLSVFCWVYPLSLTGQSLGGKDYNWIINKRTTTSPNSNSWQLSVRDGYVMAQMWDASNNSIGPTGDEVEAGSIHALSLNQWQYIGFSTNGTDAGFLNIYRNGRINYSTTLTGNRGIATKNVDIGKAGWQNNFYWNGGISNISIYNRALSAQEVLQNYNALKGRFGL